ncbi:B3 domain-containing protein [Arabidopsis thaliana]
MEAYDICKFWKLDMLEEFSQIVLKGKKKIILDIPSPSQQNKSDIVSLCPADSPETCNSSIPDWLVKVMRKENGYDPKLIIKRRVLCTTDLRKNQGCLSMHLSKLEKSDFLTEDETRFLDEDFLKAKRDGLKVFLVDPESDKHVVYLKKWNGNTVWKYVLSHGWNNVIDKKSSKSMT